MVSKKDQILQTFSYDYLEFHLLKPNQKSRLIEVATLLLPGEGKKSLGMLKELSSIPKG